MKGETTQQIGERSSVSTNELRRPLFLDVVPRLPALRLLLAGVVLGLGVYTALVNSYSFADLTLADGRRGRAIARLARVVVRAPRQTAAAVGARARR
jgi:hypothetical protein